MATNQEEQIVRTRLDRRDFLTWAGFGTAALLLNGASADATATPARKPNIVLIVADDLGYADMGFQGCKDIPTPHIDALAQGGVRFTNAYVSCPVCSPTRAGLMTGRYQQRFGHWYNPGPPAQAGENFGLPLSEITLPELLKRAGYATGMVGKWHLGLKPEFHPMKRGFDEYFGFLHGAHSYVDARADAANLILSGTEPVDEKEYLTDAFTREAVAYIRKHQGGPFFLYLTYNAVHAPLQAPQKYLDRFPNIADSKRRTYAAMLSAMDDGVGLVLETLQACGIESVTLVVFLSDNGGPPQANASCNAPLSGAKATLQEGGIRVPFLMRWPNAIPHGKTYNNPVISLDILPTCVAAAGGGVPSDRVMDGLSLMPFVNGKRSEPHEALFWKYHEGAVVRRGKWKLLRSADGSAHLYDLDKDIAETTDLAEKHPKRVERLGEILTKWEAELKPPLWGGKNQPRPARRRRQRRKPRPKI